ncbi:MAG TPA: glycosyltransferase family 2 protein [Anaerolineae bacterium]|nr:glycosyltransferase family 2 protein [Anaerolineae bacterium]HNU03893.1 glycosyltransferase family 2 protein [Anaerolineae bacterium]
MQLAVVIVNYNVSALLRACLESLLASLARTPELTAEVWVVDNASADGSAAMVAEAFPQVRLLASPDNLGYTAGNNLALQLLGFAPLAGEARPLAAYAWATGQPPSAGQPRHVWLLNPDTVVQGDAPAQLLRFLDQTPAAGACGAQLAYADGSFQHGAFRFPGLAQLGLDFFPPPGRLNRPLLDSRLNGRYSGRLYAAGKPFPVDFVLGATLLVRGETLRQVGLLDESYFMYCEEMDWQRRAQQAGWSIHCVPAAQVIHVAGASSSQFRSRAFVALWQSRLRYFGRYHGALFNRAAATLLRAGLRAEAQAVRRQSPPDLDERLAAYRAVEALLP